MSGQGWNILNYVCYLTTSTSHPFTIHFTSTHLFFFLWAVSDSWPLSSSPLEDEQDESSESLELEVEPLELSDATPVLVFRSTESASATNVGSFS
jgi:hypothetical protein